MADDLKPNDSFIGLVLNGYIVESRCGKGTIGSVYLAKRHGDVSDLRAIKFIPESQRRVGWQNEINKVTKLGLTDHVVPYLDHGDVKVNEETFQWIAWRYIKGSSLLALIERKVITAPLLYDVVRHVLAILHGCKVVGIQHGDLHAGNILVEDANPIYIDPQKRNIWVTDFGYLTASMGKDMLDDFQGLARIIGEVVNAIEYHSLEGSDKAFISNLKTKFLKDVLETDATQGSFVRDPRELLKRLDELFNVVASSNTPNSRSIGDYLAAEHIGDNYEEWKALFVPAFIGSDKLLSKNICILTGLRGCGKTMVFRRLTALFDLHLGRSGVRGSGTYTGFYLNARSIAEAFPWLPVEKEAEARAQLLNYFYLSWTAEILDWLSVDVQKRNSSVDWLIRFFKQYYDDLVITETNATGIRHLKSFITQKLEGSRLKSSYGGTWPLFQLNFLDLLTKQITANVESARGRPYYFFLDDYSTPLVNETTQRIINSVIFRRSPDVIFKIATENIDSIELEGLHGKVLQQEDDFLLIDSAAESIQRSDIKNKDTIAGILKPRIKRESRLSGKLFSIDQILGKTPYSFNNLARQLCADPDRKKGKVKYWGAQVFYGLWSSNSREIISLFAEMIASTSDAEVAAFVIDQSKPLISDHRQDVSFRNAGSRYRSLLVAATDPTKKVYENGMSDWYGERLQMIADAFQEIATIELQTKTSKNMKANPPKQARRIEITDVSQSLPDDLLSIYRGMLRYGLFLKDWRGKSARGKAVPRLYLRGILIPYYTLSFSKRDSVTMEWSQFCDFLRNPKAVSKGWQNTQRKKKQLAQKSRSGQGLLPGII